MKASLWLAPGGRHTLRFDEIEANEIARLMQVVTFHLQVQVCDHRRNILGIWQAGELRDAAVALARLNP